MADVNVICPVFRRISLNTNKDDEKITKDIEPRSFIRLKVQRQGMEPILFKMKKSTSMIKLMREFSRAAKLGLAGLRFLVDGVRIQEYDTPKTLELEDDDLIEVFQCQIGGCLILKLESSHLFS